MTGSERVTFVNRNGLRTSQDAANRWKRWSVVGVFCRMMEDLSGAMPNGVP